MATVNQVGVGLSGQTGTGSFVGATSPTLVTPSLGTPTSGTLTNCTGLPGAPYVYLSKQTASASASLNFTSLITNTYNDYFFMFSDIIPATNAASLTLQLSTNNGSSWISSGYTSGTVSFIFNANTITSATISTAYSLSIGLSAGNNPGASGYCYLTSMQDSLIAAYMGTAFAGNTSSNANMHLNSGTAGSSGLAYNAIRLILSSGNITSGYAVLYGVRQSN